MTEQNEHQRLREMIYAKYEQATTDEERTQLLEAHRALNQGVEAQLTDPDDIQQWRAVHLADYRRLIVIEATDAAGNVLPVHLAEVTEREVRAGRMAEDDELRMLAKAGGAVFGSPSRARPAGPSAFSKIKGWFGKKE